MHVPVRFASAAVGFAVLAGLTCSFPTDKSDQVYVVVTAPASVVLRGLKPLTLSAAAWRRLPSGDSVLLQNVAFQWSTSDQATATVAPEFGSPSDADVTGIKRGQVQVTVLAPGFEKAVSGSLDLRVADPLEIDTIFPDSLRWGEKLTVIGVGVRQIQLGFVNGALVRDTFSYPDVPTTKLDTAEFFVPPPSRNGPFIAASPDAFVIVPNKTIGVDTADLYSPNDTSAYDVDLNGAGPYPTHPGILFYNPALAFERPPLGSFNYRHEYYNFKRTDTTQALTFIYKPEVVNDTALTFTYLIDSVDQSGGSYFITAQTHFLYGPGAGLYVCDSLFFFANELVADSIIEPLQPLPTSNLHLLSFYRVPGRYGVTVLQGYHTQLPPDRFEPNDLWCRDKDTSHVDVVRGGPSKVLTNLTIDRPHDLDFYRFKLLGLPSDTDTVTIKIVAANGAGDPDLTVMSQDFNNYFGGTFGVGTRDSISVRLPAGTYVLNVSDFPGVPTGYALCFTVDAPCTGLPLTSASASLQAAPPRAPKRRGPPGPFAGLPIAGSTTKLRGIPLAPRR
jgi:hypothetical protein